MNEWGCFEMKIQYDDESEGKVVFEINEFLALTEQSDLPCRWRG